MKLRRLRALGFGIAALVASRLGAATFPVTSIADSGPGSLRAAILNANANPGPDTISFAIPGSFLHTIAPASALPQITDPVAIDGTTQPGYAADAPVIELSGASVGTGVDGLHVSAGGTVITGIVINGFHPVFLGGGGNGVVLETGGSNQVVSCFIGTNPAGSAAVGNATGISILNSSNNVVGGSGTGAGGLISGNGVGVVVNGTSSNNRIEGNRIGTNRSGTAALANSGDGVTLFAGDGNRILNNTISGNGGNGVSVTGSATNTIIGGNRLGSDVTGTSFVSNGSAGITVSGSGVMGTIIGTGPAGSLGNLISGNIVNGVFMTNGTTGNVLRGNLIGTNVTGAVGLGNGATAVSVVTASGNQILSNVISGNGTNGLRLRTGANSNIVMGNFIGTNAAGTATIANLGDGVQISDGSTQNMIGTSAGGNLISGNSITGIRIADAASTGNVVARNQIGTSADGVQPLPNGANGVLIENGASGNQIGTVSDPNRIAFNAGAGVSISSGSGNAVRANSIAGNGGAGIFVTAGTGNLLSLNAISGNGALGIDLAPAGVTPNDAGDADTGPNQLQNFPVLASASAAGSATHVLGSLTSAASTTYRVEFFANAACDGSGNGEGQFPLGGANVQTDSSGIGVIDAILSASAMGPWITATATDPAGNTSELSACVMLPGPIVTAITPTSGPAAGGTPVAISGMGFQSTVTVAIGGVSATSPAAVDDTHVTAVTPALSPGALYDVTVTNADLLTGTLPKGWFADFLDVPGSHPFHNFVETIVRKGVAVGCGSGYYCVNDPVTRAQVAVMLLRAHDGPTYVPPPATGTVFADVPANGFAAAWIEQLAARSVTAGCGGGNYCPATPITRAQMSVFLLRMAHGAAYVPPDATGIFTDVPITSPYARWVEELFHEGVTAGCGGGNFCPDSPNARGQMAVFLVAEFSL